MVDWSRASSTRASSGEAIDAPLSSSDGRRHGRPQTFCAREKRQLPQPPMGRPRTRTGTSSPGKPCGTRPWWPGTTRCPGNSRKRRERRRAAPPDGMAQDCQEVCQNRQGPAKKKKPSTGGGACGRSRAARRPGTSPPRGRPAVGDERQGDPGDGHDADGHAHVDEGLEGQHGHHPGGQQAAEKGPSKGGDAQAAPEAARAGSRAMAPAKPSSSPITVKMKSVFCSGTTGVGLGAAQVALAADPARADGDQGLPRV